jgi:hypothetical protein
LDAIETDLAKYAHLAPEERKIRRRRDTRRIAWRIVNKAFGH